MEEIDEWQQIEQHPSLDSSGGWNRITINENHAHGDQSSPIHEGSPLTASSSVSDEERESQTAAAAPLGWADEGKKLLKQRFEAIVMRVASMVRNCAIRAGAFWSITHVAGATAATAVLVSLVCVGVRRRPRKVDRLEYLLRQKDEVSMA